MKKSLLYFALIASAAAPVLAEPPAVVLSKNDDGINISLRRTKKGMELELRSIPAGSEPEVFALKTPSQLIVDVPTVISNEFRRVPIAHPDVFLLRYGVRKGKTRLILDFRSNDCPQFQILKPTADTPVRIRFASKDLVRDAIEPAEIAEKAPIAAAPASPASASVSAVNTAAVKPAVETKPPALETTRTARRLPPQLIEHEDPAIATSPLMMFVFGSSLLSLGAVLLLHRKKYGANATVKRSANPLEDVDYCYALLGVSSEASFGEIKTSYRQLAKRYHSDRLVAEGGNIVQIRSAEAQFHKLQQAYERIKAERGLK